MKGLKGLKNLISVNGYDAILISSVSNIIYLTNFPDFSSIEREGFLFITAKKQYIVTDGRYSEAVSKVADFELIEISTSLPLKKVLKTLIRKHNVKNLGLEEHDLTLGEFKKIAKVGSSFKNFKSENLRVVKSQKEIRAIQKACRLGDLAFAHILKKIKQGITEKELAYEIERFIKSRGVDISFEPIVAFGKNASIPHHKSTDTKLTKQSFVLLDLGAKINHYCSDMTRTIFFGKASSKQKNMYQVVFEAQKKAIDFINKSKKPKARDADALARSFILNEGFPAIPHSLGHGIGIVVHEAPHLSPKSKDILIPGMVFSIEPGIYLPGFGGVRIEDTFVLEANGLKALTKSPRDLIEI